MPRYRIRRRLGQGVGRRVRRRLTRRGGRIYGAAAMRAASRARFLRYAGYGGLGVATAAGLGYAGYRYYKRRKAARIRGVRSRNLKNAIFVRGDLHNMGSMTRLVLGANPIQMVLPPGENDQLRAAPNMTVFLKGFVMHARYQNITVHPIIVHHAIVQLKENVNSLQFPTAAIIGVNMFVDPTNNNDRYKDYDGNQANWQALQENMSLNPDKFNIMFHKKIVLDGHLSNRPDQANGKWYQFDRRYYKVNKQFEFETSSDVNFTKPFIELTWAEWLLGKPASGFTDDAVLARIQTMYTGIVKD